MIPSWKLQFEKVASTGAECVIVELEKGQWYGFVGETPSDEDRDNGRPTEWVDVQGPASSSEDAFRLLRKKHANPGGYSRVNYSHDESRHWKSIAKNINPKMFKVSSVETDLLEKLAELEHDRWSRWEKWRTRPEVTTEDEERWKKQRVTPYTELSEKEKESDRKEARLTLELLRKMNVRM